MTIDKAIKLIQEDIDDEDVEWNSPLGEAYKLAYEALKRVKRTRNKRFPILGEELPGEDKD